MPYKSFKTCLHPGCPELVQSGYCDKHKKDTKNYDSNRGTAAQRGYDSRWRKYRINFLNKNPLCVECLKEGRYVPATVVDHIKAHKGNKKLFWDPMNHQALCKQCHDKKTVREDGGFGNRGRGE